MDSMLSSNFGSKPEVLDSNVLGSGSHLGDSSQEETSIVVFKDCGLELSSLWMSQDKPVANAMSEGFLSYVTSYLDKRMRVCASDVQN